MSNRGGKTASRAAETRRVVDHLTRRATTVTDGNGAMQVPKARALEEALVLARDAVDRVRTTGKQVGRVADTTVGTEPENDANDDGTAIGSDGRANELVAVLKILHTELSVLGHQVDRLDAL